jgi:Zn-finger nucleic acid-binding protein
MIVMEYEGVELDHCVECGGTWFDKDELELLFEGLGEDVRKLLPTEAEKLPEAPTHEKRRRCPLCRKKMQKVLIGPKSDILIDVCPRGEGLWFDDTEVAALADEVLGSIPGVPGQAIDFMGRVFRKSRERKKGGSQ